MYALDQDSFRFTALVTLIAATVVCTAQQELGIPEVCGPDEYFDGVLDRCKNCSSICPPCGSPGPGPSDFCMNNCPHYLLYYCRTSTIANSFPDGRHPGPRVQSSEGQGHAVSDSPVKLASSAPGSDGALLGNSVLMTLIVCCCVAFLVLMVTAILLLVLIWRRHVTERYQEQHSPLMSRSSSANSRSTTSSASDDKKVPLMSDGVYASHDATLQLDARRTELLA
jgi:hypothetical protein